MTTASHPAALPRFDRLRYWRVVRFFAGAFLSVIWWDLILRRLPGLRGAAQRSSLTRWRRIAQRFRRLAVHMGGVLIKLGQFLSIRVDVLPEEVTRELAGLQDEVPPESLSDVQAVVAGEFGRPVDQVFDWFAPEPEAAASLAQVHKARLRDSDQEVVVKVQRARIETLVETDLAALRTAINWLKLYRPIARRVDLDRLFQEFSATTRAELDFVAEAKNAERFAADLGDDPGIYIPQVYWEYTTRRVLTLENVASIKITDFEAMEAAGIRRAQVARRLYDTYLKQIFVTNFVHADPHPGNLFVRPLEQPPEAGPDAATPFLLIFVDFGMVAVIPERLRANLRDYLIGLGTRDSRRIVQAYIDAGILLPGADRKRLEEVHDVMFERLWGVKMGQIRDMAVEEAEFFLREYRDLIYEMPFQLPADILFVGRAVGILSGMATSLDPDFDPWAATIPFAEKLATEELARDWRGWLQEIGTLIRLMLQLPTRLDQFITQAQRGELTLQVGLSPDSARALRRLERSVDRLTWGVIFASLLISGTMLRLSEGPGWSSTGLFVLAGLVLVWSITRR
jgi:predicted unusual protein kinase regulating ubiquinone biosynthesis (AarF/ABC1/UbiB family)